MTREDRDYYRFRAEVELEKAQQATSCDVVSAHYRLAEAYLDRVAMADDPRVNDRG